MVSPGGLGRGMGRAGVLQAKLASAHQQWLPSPGRCQPLSGAFSWPKKCTASLSQGRLSSPPGVSWSPSPGTEETPPACPPTSRKQERVCPGQGDHRASLGLCPECMLPSLLDSVCLALSPGRLTTWHPQRGGELRREGVQVWVDTEPRPPSGARGTLGGSPGGWVEGPPRGHAWTRVPTAWALPSRGGTRLGDLSGLPALPAPETPMVKASSPGADLAPRNKEGLLRACF